MRLKARLEIVDDGWLGKGYREDTEYDFGVLAEKDDRTAVSDCFARIKVLLQSKHDIRLIVESYPE